MRNKVLAWVSALGAVALVSGVLVVSANAHIGASHSPIDTDLPDLVSVEATADDQATYCFDEEVNDFSGAGDYFLSGYNAGTVAAGDDIDLDEDNDECIIVDFNDDRSVENFTIGYIDEGAAENRSGDESPANAVALDGSTAEGGAGITVAPNLEEWDTSGSDEIEFTFDEQVDCDRIEAAGVEDTFGYYDDEGVIGDGDSVTDCDDDDGVVTVEFTDAAEDVDDAVRVFVDENQGGVDEVCELAPVSADPNGCTSVEADGDDTEFADLEDVERTDDDEWTFTYDEDLDDGTCDFTLFHVYEEDGSEFNGTACNEDDDVVEVTFGAVPEDAEDNAFPLAAAENDAVTDADGDPSTIGDGEPGDSDEGEGFTDAPDLEVVEANDELVDFIFDESVDDSVDFDEGDFYLIDADGDTTAGDDIDDEDGDVVTVEFDPDDVDDAIGAGVDDDAVEDFNGDLSDPAAAGFGTASTSTSTTTTTTTTTDSPSTTDQPQTRRVGSTVTVRYDSTPRAKAAFKGRVLSRFKRCKSGRIVELHRRGTGVVGRDKTNRRGRWKVPYKNARGGFFAEVLRKVYTANNGDTVICKRDDSLD